MKKDEEAPKSQSNFPKSSFVIKNYEGQIAFQDYTAAITAEVYGNKPTRKDSTAKDSLMPTVKPPGNG